MVSSAAFYFGHWFKKITQTIKFLKENFIQKKQERKGRKDKVWQILV